MILRIKINLVIQKEECILFSGFTPLRFKFEITKRKTKKQIKFATKKKKKNDCCGSFFFSKINKKTCLTNNVCQC